MEGYLAQTGGNVPIYTEHGLFLREYRCAVCGDVLHVEATDGPMPPRDIFATVPCCRCGKTCGTVPSEPYARRHQYKVWQYRVGH